MQIEHKNENRIKCIFLLICCCCCYYFSASTSSNASTGDGPALPQYSVDKSFADRRFKVKSARTYFYLNEATCERNMEIFIKCLEAVSGNYSELKHFINAIKIDFIQCRNKSLKCNIQFIDWTSIGIRIFPSAHNCMDFSTE